MEDNNYRRNESGNLWINADPVIALIQEMLRHNQTLDQLKTQTKTSSIPIKEQKQERGNFFNDFH
jgi:hypothetical protein